MKNINKGLGYLAIAAIAITIIIITKKFDDFIMLFIIIGIAYISFFGD